ncbi:G2/M phase-specific E3 ubiquitin-protein ligase-like [Meleagris gallopavo]|uniref:G2/M phase-specific E3 ubiquitin-protein ligase-like n=1 Tax=Meleagris gallopavo TaxID=9103 RepID=UPI000938927C|nr:G2/M phase-specific E3 ubiquitin-protein ligase-like [Meleagris gallopavo]
MKEKYLFKEDLVHYPGKRKSERISCASRTFCWEHRPQQDTHEAPPEGTNCLICLEPVEDSLSYHTLVCPACQHAWFHRGCIQQQAVSAGALWFHCAACRDNILFFAEMAILGIQIPYRRPGWVDDDTYEALLHRHILTIAHAILNATFSRGVSLRPTLSWGNRLQSG